MAIYVDNGYEFYVNFDSQYVYSQFSDVYGTEADLSSLEYIKVLEDSRRINQVLYDEGEISKLEYLKNDLDYSAEILSAEEYYLSLIVAVEGLKGVEMGVLDGGDTGESLIL